MAVVSVGTPTKYQTTGTGTNVTMLPTWAADQPRAAGDLLVAVATASGSTSAGAITQQGGSDWTKIYEGGGTNVKAAIFTKIATGSDPAPTFQTTISGTSARCHRSAMLYQLHDNVTGYTPMLDTGGQASGTTSLTLATGANVAAANSFAIAAIAQQYTSSAANTWGTVGSWVQRATDAATAYYHYVDADLVNPATGAALSYNPTHSTSTGIGGAIAVFEPGVQVASFSGGVRKKHMAVAGSGEGISVASTGGTGVSSATYDTVGPSSAGAVSDGSRSLNWTHPAGAAGRAVLVGVSCDAASDAGWTVTATCAGNPMTALGVVDCNNQGQGLLAVFGIANQAGSSLAIVVSVAGGATPVDLEGGTI